MEHQLDFGGAPYVDTDTSRAAAVAIVPHAKAIRERVYSFIKVSGARGKTCDEIEVLMDGRHQTTSARVRDLAKDNRIKDSGDRRPTRSGRDAIVWIIA